MRARYNLPLMVGLFLAVIGWSCFSPLDTDTPRLRYEDVRVQVPPVKSARIKPLYFTIVTKDSSNIQAPWQVTLADTLVEIDTSVTPPALWMRAVVRREFDRQSPATPFIEEYRFRIDSLPTDKSVVRFNADPVLGQGASFKLATERDTTGIPRTVSLIANQEKNLASISFDKSGSTTILTGVLQINLVTHRLQAEAKITIRY